MIIYKITNTVNGKVYVGLTTTTLCNRWCKHKQDSKTCNRHLPIYSKIKRIWLLNGNEVDINNYNPVSTILESEE